MQSETVKLGRVNYLTDLQADRDGNPYLPAETVSDRFIWKSLVFFNPIGEMVNRLASDRASGFKPQGIDNNRGTQVEIVPIGENA